MFGITNAQGITGPDLETRLNAYHQGTITPLYNELNGKISLLDENKCAKDNVTALYNELSAKIGKLEKNPPVGSVTMFGGFDWLVVHWDTESEEPFMVLAMKDIYGLTAFAEDDGASDWSALSYANSKLYATLTEFENDFIASSSETPFRVSVYEAARSLIKDSETDRYAFIPTREQLRQYSLFQPNGTTSVTTATANATACYNGEPEFWWTSSLTRLNDGDELYHLIAYYVHTNGVLGFGVNGESIFTAELGFRPFIRMKMR